MIQRIQSLYLLAIAILTSLMFVQPVSVYKVAMQGGDLLLVNKLFSLNESGTNKLFIHTFPLAAVAFVIVLLSLVTIFLFKNRKRQILMSRFLVLFLLLLIALLFFYVDFQLKCFTHENPFSTTFLPGAYAPLVCLLLIYLAIRSIKKDDELVRSADRLR